METVKVLNVTAQPVGSANPSVQQCMQETVQAVNETLQEFEESENEKKAKNFLTDIKDYISSQAFKDDVNEAAKKYNVPPKVIAQGFIERAFGTVGDILGIAINVVCNAGRTVINVASTIAHSIMNLLQSIANGIASIVTLNKTCAA